MGFGEADPTLLKELLPQVFRAFYAKLPCQTLQLHNTNRYICLRQNNSLDLALTYG